MPSVLIEPIEEQVPDEGLRELYQGLESEDPVIRGVSLNQLTFTTIEYLANDPLTRQKSLTRYSLETGVIEDSLVADEELACIRKILQPILITKLEMEPKQKNDKDVLSAYCRTLRVFKDFRFKKEDISLEIKKGMKHALMICADSQGTSFFETNFYNIFAYNPYLGLGIKNFFPDNNEREQYCKRICEKFSHPTSSYLAIRNKSISRWFCGS